MVGRKVQRFKVEVISFYFRALGNGVAHSAEDVHDFIHGADDRVLCAERPANAGESYVHALRFKTGSGGVPAGALLGAVDGLFDLALELVDARAHVALGWAGRGFQPEIVDLRKNAVLARHPAVAESFP